MPTVKNNLLGGFFAKVVVSEWRLYCQVRGEKEVLKELYLGEGPPLSFLTKDIEDVIKRLFSKVLGRKNCKVSPEMEPTNMPRNIFKNYRILVQ